MADYSEFKCDYLTRNQIKKEVEAFRKEFWPSGEIPVNIERIIEYYLDLNIISVHGLWKTFEIDAFLRSDLTGIYVDNDQYMDEIDRYANRLRFSFAHEIGHLVLHKNVLRKFKFLSPEEYIQFNERLPENEHNYFENQANEFAGSLLVHKRDLLLEVSKEYEKIKKYPELLEKIKIDPENVLERIAPRLSKTFGVSEEVIRIRVEREKLWPPEE